MRGVIRSQHNAVELPAMNPLVAEAFQRGQLEFALVPDFLKAGALDQALENITVVVHLASPLANEVSHSLPHVQQNAARFMERAYIFSRN